MLLVAELERVSEQLMSHPEVSDAAAVQLYNGVVAFVVLTDPHARNGDTHIFLKVPCPDQLHILSR